MLTLLFFLGGGGAVQPTPINFAGWRETAFSRPHGETEAAKRARRIAQGIIVVPPKPVVAPDSAGQPGKLAARLAGVQQKLADNAALQAQTAALRTNAKATASIARHEAKLARLAQDHRVAQAAEAALLVQIEETDIVFVAAMMMGD